VEDQPDKSVIIRGTIYQENVPDSFVGFLRAAVRLGKDRFGS
jgi:hypothetical protein